jgi:prepilin-type N-terminal cleavage/methylation domain-containing protein
VLVIHARPDRFNRSGGFTLIESIMVLVVLGIAAVGILSLQGAIFRGAAGNKDIQVSVQLMQECAEVILAKRRASGYSDALLADTTLTASTACNAITLANYDHPTVTIKDGSATGGGGPTTIAACPTTAAGSCKLVTITRGGLTPITLMLVSY